MTYHIWVILLPSAWISILNPSKPMQMRTYPKEHPGWKEHFQMHTHFHLHIFIFMAVLMEMNYLLQRKLFWWPLAFSSPIPKASGAFFFFNSPLQRKSLNWSWLMSPVINSNFFPFIPSGPFHNVNISCAYQPRFLSQSNQRQGDHISFSVSEKSLRAAASAPLNVEIGC